MNSVLRKVGSAMSPLALLVAILALVVSAAGVGYAAGQIGTKQIKNKAITAKKIKNDAVTTKKIKNNAVTAAKIPDGSLTAADLVPNEAEKAGVLGNGGQGDCVWQGGGALIAGVGSPTYRKDRFGTVHVAGLAISADGPGGDAVCDFSDPGESADAIVFTLPAGYIPAKSQVIAGASGGLIIAGPLGVVSGTLVLPPGAVAGVASSGGGVSLDGLSFEPVGSSVVIPKMTASGQISDHLIEQLGLN